MNSDRPKASQYLNWAKIRKLARYDLATSGVSFYPLRDLGVTIADLELNGPGNYGYEPLQNAIANRYAVPVECVMAAATGTSMANHLVLAALLDPNDDVLIEEPAYEPLLAVARYLGARIHRFQRSFENDFRIDMSELERKLTSSTRLIVITNLHNPTGVETDDQTLRAIGALARSAGSRVLVDEVYSETRFEQPGRTAFHLGTEFIATNSLTKAYGLNGLRCGWIIAEPAIIAKCWRLNDLFGVIPAHPAELLSVIAFQRLQEIAARSESLLQTNRALVHEFLNSRNDLQWVWPDYGTIVFPRLPAGKGAEFCAFLRNRYDVSVVPGSFFGMEDHFRLGMGGPSHILEEGLKRLAKALVTF